MESQIERMKSSIANIQLNLRKLEAENEETTKYQENDDNILPQSLISEDAAMAPQPTPKITDITPNITHTDIYTPPRHHLDDSEMKKALQQMQTGPLQKSKSQTVKSRFIYEGSRVVYQPPSHRDHEDYGQIVIKTKRSHISSSENSFRSSEKKKRRKREINPNQAYYHKSSGNKKSRVGQQKTEKKMKKYKVSEHPPIKIDVRAVQQYQSGRIQEVQSEMRNFKTQCNLKRMIIKEPFMMDLKSDTDSNFSEMSL